MFNVDELRRQIEALIRDNPLMEEDETLRADMIDAETGISEVLTLLLHEIDNSEFMVVGITERRKVLAERRDRLNRRVEALRDLALLVLQSANLKKVQLPEATLVQSASQPTIVGEPDVTLLPADMVRIKSEPDRSRIRQALLDGRELPGLSLSNAAPHLVIHER